MKTELLHFTDKNINRIFFEQYRGDSPTNKTKITGMKKFLFDALDNELTDRQRLCLIEHYLYGKPEKKIAEELGLNPSTVSRHISYAKRKLQRIASYYS